MKKVGQCSTSDEVIEIATTWARRYEPGEDVNTPPFLLATTAELKVERTNFKRHRRIDGSAKKLVRMVIRRLTNQKTNLTMSGMGHLAHVRTQVNLPAAC